MKTVDDFYAAVGYGAISTQQVVTRLGVVDDAHEVQLPQVAPAPARPGGVRVRGVGDLLVRFSKCCHPIPGDPIVGYITRGRGVTVHLGTCPTLTNEKRRRAAHRGRVGDAAAADLPDRHPHRGLRPHRAAVRHQQRRRRDKINIVAASVATQPDHRAIVQATLEVASVAQLSRVMSRLEQLKDVYSVQRDHG